MPWVTPTLKNVRAMTRDTVAAALATAQVPKNIILSALNASVATLGNSFLRVISDAQSGLAHMTLRYLDWITKQLMPDTAETIWLDRHAQIWLSTASGARGRKAATYSTGPIIVTGTQGVVVPAASQLTGSSGLVTYETLENVTIAAGGSQVDVRALDAGTVGNLTQGEILTFLTDHTDVDGSATAAVDFSGGTDTETDDELRMRVLERIQQPPAGGDAEDWVHWMLEFPGVTRAWSYPLEMGIGTVVGRFMMDDLRASNAGIPTAEDVLAVSTWMDTVRPVAVKDTFIVAPIPFPINLSLSNITPDSSSMRAAVEVRVAADVFDPRRSRRNHAPELDRRGDQQRRRFELLRTLVCEHADANERAPAGARFDHLPGLISCPIAMLIFAAPATTTLSRSRICCHAGRCGRANLTAC